MADAVVTPEVVRRRIPALAALDDESIQEQIDEAVQLIRDECSSADQAAPATLRRVVIAMLKRSVPVSGEVGVTSLQEGAGPFQRTTQYANPSGDLYLTKAEKRQLGCGRQAAFEVDLLPPVVAQPGGP